MEERSYTSELSLEMERRKAHLETLPGARLKNDLDALNRCSYIIGENGKELAAHVSRFLNSRQNVNELSDQYVNELVRLLHNYLASVTSLIDAQRVVMRHRWPTEKKGDKPEFETRDYTDRLRVTFETGEAEFMVKLRNYCTHYSVPVPGLGTTISWQNGGPVLQVNTLQLDREKLRAWDGWGAAGKAYLTGQEAHFDLAPIIERYMKSVREFYNWFWNEITSRSGDLQDELKTKANELQLWHDEKFVRPEWLVSGEEPPADWNQSARRVMRRLRAERRRARYAQGTHGFAVSTISPDGEISFSADEWRPLPR